MLKLCLFLLVVLFALIQGVFSSSCPSGFIPPLAATNVIGQLSFTSAAAVDLRFPYSIAVSPASQMIFISESFLSIGVNAIVRYNNSALYINGGGSSYDRLVKNSYSCSNSNLKPGYHSLAFGANDDLYISEGLSHRVVVLAEASLAVAGTPLLSRIFGQVSLGVCLSAELNFPAGIHVDHQRDLLWVADSKHHKVKAFSINANVVATLNPIITLGSYKGCTPANFKSPEDVIVDDKGNVWVADAFNSRVVMFPSNGTTGGISLHASVVLGQQSLTSCKSNLFTSIGKAFSLPSSLAFDDTYLYVLDRHWKRVMSFVIDDIVSYANPAFQIGQPSLLNVLASLTLQTSFGGLSITVEADSGSLLVADKLANRVLVFCSPLPLPLPLPLPILLNEQSNHTDSK